MQPTALLVLLLLTQLPNGRSVSGSVVDPSGAPVPAARVRVLAPGRPVESITGADGSFRFDATSDAPFRIRVSAYGFAEETLVVGRGAVTDLRVVLTPAGISERVNVSANPERSRVLTPASATVFDQEALARAAAWTLDEQLRSVPGFSLFRRSSSRVANPTTQGATLRGLVASGASRTAVFADGIPLNDPFGGWVYWDRIPMASIDHVEVARGGSSDLHGTDALGGAVRIATASHAGSRVWLDAGSDATARLSAYTGATHGRWRTFGTVEGATTDGFVIVAPESRGSIDIPASSEYASGVAGIGATLADRLQLGLRASYFTEDRGNGTPFQTNATIVRQASASADGDVAGGIWTLRAAGSSQDYDQTFSAVAADRESERPTSRQHVDASSASVTGEWLRGVPRGSLMVAGAFRSVDADLFEEAVSGSTPPTLTPASQRSAALAAHWSGQPSDRLTTSVGIRGELWRTALRDPTEGRTRSRLLPRASVAFRLSESVSLRTAVHHAYRVPTINELYRPFRVGSILTRANPALGPEKSYGFEGAILFRKGRTAARAVGFGTRLDDAIVNVTLQSTPAIVRERQNAGRIRAAGVELEGELRAGVFTFAGAAAFIDSVFTEGEGIAGLQVPQVPRWQGYASVHAVWPRAIASVDWRAGGQQFDDDRNQFALDATSTVGARAGWRPRPSFEVFVAVENLLDEEQDVGRTPLRTIGLPRTARVGVRWTR